MAGLSQAIRESSTASLTDDSLSSSGSCIVVSTTAGQASHIPPTPDFSKNVKVCVPDVIRTKNILNPSSPSSLRLSKTSKTSTDNTRYGNNDEKADPKKGPASDSGRDRRKSSRLESITKATLGVIATTASVLGKRSREALKDTEEKLKTIQGKRKSLRPIRKENSALVPDGETMELSRKEAVVSAPSSLNLPVKAEMPYVGANRPKRSQKKYLASGLYVGQASDFDARLTEKKNQMKRASKAAQAETTVERKFLPMPMYGGKRLLDSGRFFKLPFDVYSPLPPGQPKPDEWRKTQSNRFVGDSVLEWKKLKPLEASRCLCTPENGCDDDCQNRYMLYECDDTNCNVGAQWCTNRAFSDLKERHKKGNKYDIGVDVIKTAAKGFGVRANRTFEPNQIIVEYAGEIITQEEAERRMMNEYKNNECYYLMMFDQNMIIDGTRGSIARFVNHSCEPNCRIVKWIVAGKPRIALFAGDDGIMTGEELTYDYNFDPFSQKNVQACKCGAPSCRGVLGPRPKERDSTKNLKSDLTSTKLKRKAEVAPNASPLKKKPKSSNEGRPIQIARPQTKTSAPKQGVNNSTPRRSPVGKENTGAGRISKDAPVKRASPLRRKSTGNGIRCTKRVKKASPKKNTSPRIEKRQHTIDALSGKTSSFKRAAAILKINAKNGNRGACKPTTIEMYFGRA